ncbi:MAG: GTPase HflX [Chthoniobacterales bacterium]
MTVPFPTRIERAILVGVEQPGVDHWDLQDSLAELSQLAATAGAEVVDTFVQKLEKPTAPFYIGKGKAEEIRAASRSQRANSLIFDDELSPAQGRNLEKLTSRKVLDRTQLILDIFAKRARTREGRLQIELAQLQYLLPRLTRMWTHLSRQDGGIGTRGPGETQLEVDRRRVQDRIARLERDLKEVRKHRTVQREGRLRQHWPVCAVVGYTNAGKSSLLNRLTGSHVLAADKLFATLDPTTRQFVLPNKQKILLTDTVGFIRKLPHTVIESFKATLEEVALADLLLHVVDISHPQFHEQMVAVDETIAELDARGKQTVLIFNKIDQVADPAIVASTLDRHPGSVGISARTGEGIEIFLDELVIRLAAWRLKISYQVPTTDSAAVAEIHRIGHVLNSHYNDETVDLVAHVPPELKGRFTHYEVES